MPVCKTGVAKRWDGRREVRFLHGPLDWPVRLSVRSPVSQAGKRGATPLRATDRAKWRNGRRARLRTLCPRWAWEFNSPLGHFDNAGWTGVWFQLGLISRITPVQIRLPRLGSPGTLRVAQP